MYKLGFVYKDAKGASYNVSSPLLFLWSVCQKLIFPLSPPPPHFLFRKVLGVQTQLAPRAHRTKQVVEDQSQQLTAATPPSWLDQSEAGLTLPLG